MKLAVIPGDGIGVEVTEQALRVLDAVQPGVEPTQYDLGAARWHRTGEVLPDSVLEEIRGHDAILLGAVGDPSVPSGVLERGLLLRLRFELDHYVNLRPAKLYPGVDDAAGRRPGDRLRRRTGRAPRVRTPATAACCARAPRTRSRPRSASTPPSAWSGSCGPRSTRAGPSAQAPDLVHKNNVLVYAGDLWSRTVQQVADGVPGRDGGLPPRRRGDDLPGHRSRAATT